MLTVVHPDAARALLSWPETDENPAAIRRPATRAADLESGRQREILHRSCSRRYQLHTRAIEPFHHQHQLAVRRQREGPLLAEGGRLAAVGRFEICARADFALFVDQRQRAVGRQPDELRSPQMIQRLLAGYALPD